MSRARQRSARRIAAMYQSARAIAEQPTAERWVVESFDVPNNEVTVHRESDQNDIQTITADLSGVLPPVGSVVRLDRNQGELILNAPVNGRMSATGEFSSPDFPGFNQGGPGWGIDGQGRAEFWQVLIRGSLLLGSQELFANPDFEPPSLLPWTAVSGAGAPTRVNSPTHGGSWACQITNGSGQFAIIESEDIPTVEGEVVWSHEWVRAATGSGDRFAYMNIRFLTAANVLVAELPLFVPINTRDVYVDAFIAAQAPAGTAKARVRVGGWRPTTGSITVFVDDLRGRKSGVVQGAYLQDAYADNLIVGERLVTDRIIYKPAGVEVARIANQFIPAQVATYVVWNAKENDVPYGNMWTSGANVTIREDGLYTASGGVTWAVDPDASGFGGATAIDMAGTPWSYRNPVTPLNTSAAHGTQWMKAGETIRMLLYHASGSNIGAFMTVNRVVTG